MSINRWMDKEAVVHIYNGILLSHKKECIWIHFNWIDETRAYYTSEASQKEKYKYRILTHVYGILKDGDGLVAKSCPTLATPWTVACKVPLSMGFSRKEYWSGLPFPSPEDLLDPGIEPGSPALQADSLPTELQGKHVPNRWHWWICFQGKNGETDIGNRPMDMVGGEEGEGEMYGEST